MPRELENAGEPGLMITQLIQACWKEEPRERPGFEIILIALKDIIAKINSMV